MNDQPTATLAAAVAADPNATFVRDLMSPPIGVFGRDMTVADTVEQIRKMSETAIVTYCYVTDDDGRLEGLVVMRDMLLATPETKLGDIMLTDVFSLGESTKLSDALKEALHKHFPVYPVCDAEGRLSGLIRGTDLFAEQAIEISAQAGQMVGVEKEERTNTPFSRSLRFRHPWLQINLLTAFAAAAVVGVFESTIERLVVLAVFLPVMAGQTGNTGLQALAVTLRGMTLGEIKPGSTGGLLAKETMLGFLNGLLVGITAGLGMFAYAVMTGAPGPFMLALTVTVAMTASCTIAGFAGASIPMVLKTLRRRSGDLLGHLPHHRQRYRQPEHVPGHRHGAAALI